MTQMRNAVDVEVLRPQGIDVEAFIDWIQTSGLVRGRATKAAMFAHHAKSLDGFRSLAREYLDTGGRARQRRGY
jgi:hypothetical protein